jgi:hypothetical protein
MSKVLDKARFFKSHHKKMVRYFTEGVILAILLGVLFVLGGRALCKVALDQLASMTGTKITDDSVDFNLDGSVVIKNLLVRPDREMEYDDAILKAETVYARFSIGSILILQPRLKEILVRDFAFNAQHDVDSGEWNVSGFQLRAPRGEPAGMPEISLQRGAFHYSKVKGGKVEVIATVPVEARLGPDETFKEGCRFIVTSAEVADAGKNTLEGTWQPGVLTISGGISSANIPAFGLAWNVQTMAGEVKYDSNNDYTMKLNMKDLSTSQKILGKEDAAQASVNERGPGLFGALQWFFNRYRPWGVIDIELERQGNLKQLDKDFKMNGTVFVKDASISDLKFPYAINNLAGQIKFTERSAVLDDLHGWHNQVELAINGRIKGFGPDLQSDFSIQSKKMLLDDDLYTALKPEHKLAWDDFSPTPQSFVATDYRVKLDGEKKAEKVLTIDLLGTNARYHRFPYPLENLRGRLVFSGGDIEISDVVSRVGQRRLTVNGQVRPDEGGRKKYDVVIDAENIPLDSVLLSALPQAQRQIYEQLGVSGFADGQVKIFTPSEGDKEADFTADVSFKQASFEGKEFPFLITNVSGEAVFTEDSILIKGLRGRYGGGNVNLTGTAWPGKTPQDWGYTLDLGAKEVELGEDFVGSFPQWLGMNLSKLQSEGQIDFTAHFDKAAGAEPDYAIDLDCLGNSINFEYFPYPLSDVRGRVELRRESIRFDNLSARTEGDVQIGSRSGAIEMDGQVILAPDGWEQMEFDVEARDIWFDERFGNALPANIGSSYRRFSPTGRFDLHGVKIGLANNSEGDKVVDFEGDVTFKNCSVETFAPITGFNARLGGVKGSYGTKTGFTSAEGVLDVDSFRIKGALLKDFHANILYNEPERKWHTKNIVGDFYGGGLTGNFELKQSTESGWMYTLDAGFDDVQLEKFLEDAAIYGRQLSPAGLEEWKERESATATGQQLAVKRFYTKGQLGGSFCLEERLGEGSSNSGRIRLSVRDMEVGRLSPISKLLLVLNLTEPTDFAFDKMLVDSYIYGNMIDFDKFDLSGESVAFTGSGKLNLKSREVDLKLTARGKRLAGTEPGILESITEGLGSGIVRMDVKGDIYDPEITTKTLPVLEATLGILGGQDEDASQ